MNSKATHFSVTDIKNASLCPRMFVINKKYKKRVFRGKTSGVGSLIHLIIAKFAKKALESKKFKDKLINLNESELKTLFRNGVKDTLIRTSQSKDMDRWNADEIDLVNESLLSISTDLFTRYLELKSHNEPLEALKKLFIAIEWSFKHIIEIIVDNEKNLFEIAGRIDWLTTDINNESLILWDFKTSPEKNLERDIAQVAIYCIMVEEIFEVKTHAALMYISGDTIQENKIDSDTLEKFKPSVLKTIYEMKNWLRENKEIPFTQYQDACDDCIVKKMCIKKFGTNPHLEKLEIELVEEVKEIEEKIDDFEIEEEIIPDGKTILKTVTKVELDQTKSHKVDISQFVHKKLANANLGTILRNNKPLEIHPNVLLRHVVTLGATGSGKTVLGKVLIEEILLQGYSAILIDPQGDLCSLVLADDNIGKKLVKDTEFNIFTPNSEKGINLTVDILSPPPDEVIQDHYTLLTYLDATATQLLSILDYNILKTPPEKALLESILKYEWINKNSLNLRSLAEKISEAEVIRSVQDDSEIEIDMLITPRKQKELSQRVMKLVVGVEGSFFSGGESLDFDKITKKKSHLSIINLASVGPDPSKRQLVVSWILRQIYDWILLNPQREQDKIRFFLYIDEVADFMPPHPYNPPSKKMLMLLMRQARKYGCAMIIATQSPATIDYKAIDNIGTIFVGKITAQQSINKIKTFLEPYGIETQKMLNKVQTVNPGEFLLVGGGYTRPEFFKTRWLHTKHQTLTLDDIEKLSK